MQDEPEVDLQALLRVLALGGVEFIVVGGMAAVAHGAARVTYDVDVVVSRRRENLERLVEALAPHEPYLRGAPPGLPFRWDARTLSRGVNFTLTTNLGALDVFGEVIGGGTYEDLEPDTEEVELLGVACKCLGLRKLIEVKRAAGRPKDYEAIAELESILEESN